MRGRWVLPTLMLTTVLLTFASVALLARFSAVIPNHVQRELEHWRELDGIYLFDNGYIDDADYVLIDQVPRDDHSAGGVYFIGDSQSNTGIMTWTLPTQERALIRNYSLGDMHHHDARLFIEMLVRDYGLLEAGGENVTIFLGLSFYMARPRDYEQGSYLSAAFERHALYEYQFADSIRPARMTPIERYIRIERDRAFRVLQILFGERESRIKRHTPEQQIAATRGLGDAWREPMLFEIQELAATLDYLQARGVRVYGLFRPSGSWEDELPYERAYRAIVEPMLSERGIPLIDQTDLFPDSDFADGEHLSYRGQRRLHEIDRQLALQALADMRIDVAARD